MIKEIEQATSLARINIVMNWIDELKRRVPVK